MKNPKLKPEYSDSRALIIGINEFLHASPLQYALSDAEAVRDTLIKKFDFSTGNIRFLCDSDATRANIMSAYMSFSEKGTKINDRLLIFYAGHGLTHTGARGEVGFLVPYDGNSKDLSTLIRWDELTFNAELINAKHILFIMDACYGGLALSRGITAGSMRFLKDMLLRPVRQVLTAGKANQTVADSGGPRPHHSVFTGHLLDALDGRAETEDSVITANGVMAYVYDKVSKDIHSQQTPHFGFFDGDGDFIFKAPHISALTQDENFDKDILVTIPSTEIPEGATGENNLVDLVKEHLSESSHSIRLHDLAILHVRRFLVETAEDKFPCQGVPFSVDEFLDRLERYEMIIHDLRQLTSCIAYWGEDSHIAILQKAVGRATDHIQAQSDRAVWNVLRWYPIIILFYSAGIAALSARKYDNLFALFTTPAFSPDSNVERTVLLQSLGSAISELEGTKVFKNIPSHEKHYVPRSEYLFKFLQPDLDDLFFLGTEFEQMFDRLEVMFALSHADLMNQRGLNEWGPIGRFGWKYHGRSRSENPLKNIIEEAKEQGASWAPLKAGFFGRDINRFKSIASIYEGHISKLGWW